MDMGWHATSPVMCMKVIGKLVCFMGKVLYMNGLKEQNMWVNGKMVRERVMVHSL